MCSLDMLTSEPPKRNYNKQNNLGAIKPTTVFKEPLLVAAAVFGYLIKSFRDLI